MMDLGLGSRIRIHSLGQARPEPVFTARTSQEQALPSPVGARDLEPTRGSLCFPRRGLTPHQRSKAYASLFGSRTTQESFRESFMKELGRLEAQLAGLRQELAALTLEQSSVADQVGLLPQQLQAMRDDVSWNCPAGTVRVSRWTLWALRPSVLGVCAGQSLFPCSLLAPQALALGLAQGFL